MRIAVLSDIHGNGYALTQVLKDAKQQSVDKYFFLGDSITDGPDVNTIVATTKAIGEIVLIGNREEYLLELQDAQANWHNSLQFQGYLRSFHHTSQATLDYLKTRTISASVEIQRKKIKLFHGVPNKTRKVFVPMLHQIEAKQWIETEAADIYIGGHTHIAYQYYFENRWFFNPGSVGLPLRVHGFCYGILEIANNQVLWEQRVLPYDVNEIIQYNNIHHPKYQSETGIWSELFYASLQSNRDEVYHFFQIAYEKANIQAAIGETKLIDDSIFRLVEKQWRTKNAR